MCQERTGRQRRGGGQASLLLNSPNSSLDVKRRQSPYPTSVMLATRGMVSGLLIRLEVANLSSGDETMTPSEFEQPEKSRADIIFDITRLYAQGKGFRFGSGADM
jgi:hypothetical protein